MKRTVASICDAIDDLIPVQIEVRKSDGQLRPIAETARAKQGGMTGPASESLIEGLRDPSSAVVMSSGWLIEEWFPKGELCGMIGAVGLLRFFIWGMHRKVLFATEEELVPIVEALIRTAGVRSASWDSFRRLDVPQACVMPFPKESDAAEMTATDIVESVSPGGLVTVEKCGPSASGVFHSGQGTDMSATTARIDLLVERFRQDSIPTVGVGDLGNEIGFGVIADETRDLLGDTGSCRCGCGDGIVTETSTDVLVVGSSSNRAAMGLEGALGAMTGRSRYVRDGRLESALTATATREGAVDSFTVSPSPTDGHGVPSSVMAGWVDVVRFMSDSTNEEFPMFGARD